jgi:hypothetical protein
VFQFDQVCFEDESTNRLQEALTVFDNVCNSKWFAHTPIILLFNKIDIFRVKIVDWQLPLTSCFEDYSGDRGDYQNACDFIWEKFRQKVDPSKKIYRHYVCATADDSNIDEIFYSINVIVQAFYTANKRME